MCEKNELLRYWEEVVVGLILVGTCSQSYFLFLYFVLMSRQRRSRHDGCYCKVGLPLIENTTIVQQPLDLWRLTEQYKLAATRIIQNARYNTTARVLIVELKHSISLWETGKVVWDSDFSQKKIPIRVYFFLIIS